jgi:hypothetical protein
MIERFRSSMSATLRYALEPGSECFRDRYWQRTSAADLKSLIKRFATRENRARSQGEPSYLWRVRRLRAVNVYKSRFGSVPAIFGKHALVPMKSYYVHDGRYVWPERGEPGRPVTWHLKKGERSAA